MSNLNNQFSNFAASLFAGQRLMSSTPPGWAEPIQKSLKLQLENFRKRVNMPADVITEVEYVCGGDYNGDLGMFALTVRRGNLLGIALTGFTDDWRQPAPQKQRLGEIEYDVHPLASRTFTEQALENIRSLLINRHFAANERGDVTATIMSKQVIYNQVLPTLQADQISQLLIYVFGAGPLLLTAGATQDFSPDFKQFAEMRGQWVPELRVGHNDRDLFGSFIAADAVLSVYFVPQGTNGQKGTERLLAGNVYIQATASYQPNHGAQGQDAGRTWQPNLIVTGIESGTNQSTAWIMFLLGFMNQLGLPDNWQPIFGYNVPPNLRRLREPGGYCVEAPMTEEELTSVRNGQGGFLRSEPVTVDNPGEYQQWWRTILMKTFHRNPGVGICVNRASGDAHWTSGLVNGGGIAAVKAIADMFPVEIANRLGIAPGSASVQVASALNQRYPVVTQEQRPYTVFTGTAGFGDGTRVSLARVMNYLTAASLMMRTNPTQVSQFGVAENNPQPQVGIDQRLRMVRAAMPDADIQLHDFAIHQMLNMEFMNILFSCLSLNVAPLVVTGAEGWAQAGAAGRMFMAGVYQPVAAMVQNYRANDGFAGVRGNNPYDNNAAW